MTEPYTSETLLAVIMVVMKHMNATICDTKAFATNSAFAPAVMLDVSSESLKISTVKKPLQHQKISLCVSETADARTSL